MPLQNTSHDVTLDAYPTAVNDSNFLKPGLSTLLKIFLNDARDIFGSEGMEIDGILYGKHHRFGKRRLLIRIRSF